MKRIKSIILSCLAAVCICAAGASVGAEELISIDIKDGETIAATYTMEESDTGFLAIYDDEQLVGVNSTALGENTAEVDFDVNASSGDYTVKAFLWNDMVPKSNAVSTEVTRIYREDIETIARVDGLIKIVTNNAEFYMAEDCLFNVNGVEADFDYYIKNQRHTFTDLILTKTNDNEQYNGLYMSVYLHGVVEGVVLEDNKINFKAGTCRNLRLSDFEYKIIYNGKKIELSDLKENDVLNVQFDTEYGIYDSDFVYFTVTRKVVEGTFTGLDKELGYKIDDTYYKLPWPEEYDYDYSILNIDYKYRIYADYFGLIVDYEETGTNVKFGIIEDVVQNGNHVKVTLYSSGGQLVTYNSLEEDYVYNYEKYLRHKESQDNVSYRMVSYCIDPNQKIYNIASPAVEDEGVSTYNAEKNRLGFVYLDDNVKIINILQDDTVESYDKNNLVHGQRCEVYVTDRNSTTGKYRFAVIRDNATIYNDETKTAVFLDSFDEGEGIKVLYEGEEKEFLLNGYFKIPDLRQGDVIVFRHDENDKLIKIDTIFKGELYEYENLQKQLSTVNPDNFYKELLSPLNVWEEAGSDIDVYFGPIIKKQGSKSVSIAQLNSDGVSKDSENGFYTLNSETKVYVYDFSKDAIERLYIGSLADVIKTSIPNSAKNLEDGTVDWNNAELNSKINYAFIKSNDDVAEEIFVLLADIDNSYSPHKYGILEKVYENEGGYFADIISGNGEYSSYMLKDENEYETLKNIAYNVESEKNNIQDRVIAYKLTDTEIDDIKAASDKTVFYGKYSKALSKIGNVKLNENSVLFTDIDIEEGEPPILISQSNLVNLNQYLGYMFNYDEYNKTYEFMIIMNEMDEYVDETEIAVFLGEYTVTEHNEEKKGIKVLYKGETKDIILTKKELSDGLTEGDIIVFKQDGYYEITQIDVVFDNDLSTYGAFQEQLDNSDPDNFFSGMLNYVGLWTDEAYNVELNFGPIVNKSGSRSIEIAQLNENGISDEDDSGWYSINSETKVYVCDFDVDRNKFHVGSLNDIVKTSIPRVAKDIVRGTIDWNHDEVKPYINYAFVKSSDYVAKEIFVIIAEY